MHRKLFYSALLLTGVNLLLRVVGTSFQVYLSGRIGAEGIGLLQLVMSVASLALVIGVGGIRTAAMYLTAAEIGRGREQNTASVLSGCFLYSILCSSVVALGLYLAAPWLSAHWIGNSQTLHALRLTAAFLPGLCLCSVMTGYFTAANRIGMLAAVEAAEQLIAMAITMTMLTLWAGQDSQRACLCVVLGTNLGCCLTLLCLVGIRVRQRPDTRTTIPVRSRLMQTALPLALADTLRSGISTTENLMVPRRLALFAGEANPLAAFGRISGMVFPVLMFPACILFGLSELLIPELARCTAAGRTKRTHYLIRRSLRTALLYGLFFSGVLFLIAKPLCIRLYSSPEAGQQLQRYALLVPFLYTDAITDAMTKGLGQQKVCVRYNILTSAMDVILLFLLLPRFGMTGYFWSFLITHLLNFLLSLSHLCRITGLRIPFSLPCLGTAAALAAVLLARLAPAAWTLPVYLLSYPCLLTLFGLREDLLWLRHLVFRKQPA